MHRWPIIIVALLIVCSTASAQTKRRVFVLHSGMHIILAPEDKNHAAKALKKLLKERGIAERNLVALDSPYPTASWDDMVPKGGLMLYLESADPASRTSQDAYVRLHKALEAQGVGKNDEIVWIGHSAGGQMGMTMAHLAHNLDKYSDLAKKTQAYRFDAVITLGAAVGSDPVPAGVKLWHYFSAGDTMIFFLSNHGKLVADSVKSKVRFRACCDLRPGVKVRLFPGIEHGWWPTDENVLACILREFMPNDRPGWRRPHAEVSAGMGLSQLIAESLESELRISLEENRQ
jgi:pimeloyl-ACP methyl ester carboxylesterase